MDGVEITSLVTSFVDQSLPRSRSGSGRFGSLPFRRVLEWGGGFFGFLFIAY
jgi:hypothetical protein